MNRTFIFVSILFFASCGIIKNNLFAQKIETTDKIEKDSVLVGKSFELNNMLCHWEYIISDEVIIKLKNSQTNEVLWEGIDINYDEKEKNTS